MAAVPVGGPGALGVEEVKAASVTIRLAVKTRPSKRDDIARQLRASVERALEQAGIPLLPVAESLLVAPGSRQLRLVGPNRSIGSAALPAATMTTTQAPDDHRHQRPREEKRNGPTPYSTVGDPGRAPSASGPVRSCRATAPARPQPAAAYAGPAAPAGQHFLWASTRLLATARTRPDVRSRVAAGPAPGRRRWPLGLGASGRPLARRFQVITIDNRGIGASDTPPGNYSTRAMANDVLAVLDHAGIQRASLIGTSLGGMIAQELALAHPERVDKLVLVATVLAGPAVAPCPWAPTYWPRRHS